jgi:hypothetical protein
MGVPRHLTGSRTADREALRVLARDREAAEQTLKNELWRMTYSRWPKVENPEPGYTMILPVPGDMPVFLYLSLATALNQDPTGRVETIVVPDRLTPEFSAAFETARRAFDAGPIRLVPLSRTAQALQRVASDDPSKNYFIQVHAGLQETRTTHALLHDADLFIHDRDFLAGHYRRCAEENLACLGVSECWDGWLRDHGFGHVVATWELMLDTRWLREFAPWEHRGHHAWVDGEWHGFDVTLYTQALTPAARVGLNDATDRFEHFNWVICTYRHFHGRFERPFEDHRFVLLLIRLLADALATKTGSGMPSVDLPDLDSLVRGVTDPAQPITFRSEEAAANYPEFRARVSRILEGPLFDDEATESIESALGRFDEAFAVTGSAAA